MSENPFAPYNKPFEALRAVYRCGPALVEYPADFLPLLFVAERTASWQKAADAVSLRQFVAGVRRRDGKMIRSGCGIQRSTLKRALARLEKCGLLVRERRRSKREGDVPTEYRIVWTRVAEMIESVATPVALKGPPPGPQRAAPVALKGPHSKNSYSKDVNSKPASQPSANVVAETGIARGGLAGLLTEVWQHLPGTPGAKLLARVAEALGDTPVEYFCALLVESQAKVQSFGLALELARDARRRWESGPIPGKKPPERQGSLFERTEALMAERVAKGKRPI